MVRIGIQYNLNLMNANIRKNRESYTNSLQPLATGRRVNSLKDDPTVLTEYFRIQEKLKRKDQYGFNISSARTRVDLTDSVLQELNDLVNEALQVGIQARNGTLNSDDLNNAISRLNDIDSSILDIANTKVGNVYLFSGFLSSTQPFDGTPGTFNGDTNDVKVKVTQTKQVTVNVSGDDLFTGGSGNQDIFQAIDDLISGIQNQNNAAPNDEATTNAIGNAIDALYSVLNQVSEARSEIGNTQKELTASQRFLDSLQLTDTDRLSTLIDTDIAAASTELSFKQFTMESAFAVANKVVQVSLTSFLN